MGLQLAIRNDLKHPFNQEKSEVGKKWLRSFLKRHPVISMRTEGISAARVKGFTSENVARFFDIYESERRKVYHPVHRIFNVDETGKTTVQHGHGKVISMRGKKEVISLNTGRKRKSNHCCHLYVCHWLMRSAIHRVPEKKYERGAYGWNTDGLNFGLPFRWLDSDGYIY
jgi:hypothetical protein